MNNDQVEALRQVRLARDGDDPRVLAVARAQFAQARRTLVRTDDLAALDEARRSAHPGRLLAAAEVDMGHAPPPTRPDHIEVLALGRNKRCPCGSGAKFKWCCA